MSARILLINPSGWQKESINLGLCYVAGALLRAGHDVLILDMNTNQMSDGELTKAVAGFKPIVVGLSVKTATANEAGRVLSLLSKRFEEMLFVAGGPHITLCADSFMASNAECDYAIMGEGEISFERLVAAVLNNTSPACLEGVVYRDRNEIVINPWKPPEDLDALPKPDLDVIAGFSWSQFRYPVVTSRGCPFGCIYCCVNKLTGSRKWRARSASNVVDELEQVMRSKGITLFEIWDDNFTLDIVRAKSICREIIRRGLNLSWYCHNGIRADRIDRELAVLMKNAGCTSIAFGIESGNPAMFDSIKKGETLSAVVDAVHLVKDVGMNAVGYFIIGLPGDTLEHFIETVRFQRSLHLDHYVFGMLIPYPKTEVWDMVCQRGTLFCDITETQHFSSDIVPVSFELPEFPRDDMVRAFYIAKYFELFDAVDELARGGKTATVIYLSTPSMIKHIPGMVTACPGGTKHFVVGKAEEEIRSLPSFKQVSESMEILFVPSLPATSSLDDVVIVALGSTVPTASCMRATVITFDPHNTLQHTMKLSSRIDQPKQRSLTAKIVFRLKPLFSRLKYALKNRLKRFRLIRSLHYLFMQKIMHGVCVLRNRIILQRLRVRDRLIHFYVHKIRHRIRVLRNRIILQLLRVRDGMHKIRHKLYLLRDRMILQGLRVRDRLIHFYVHKIRHRIRVLRNRIILQGLRTRDRLIHFYVHKIRHRIRVLRNRIILQRLRVRDRLILIRRYHSTKMTFVVDVLRFSIARKALRSIDSKKVKINFDEYSSYL
jgi:anaerobic magnesium-protoporphyrin IX monomethyl ester cyclase